MKTVNLFAGAVVIAGLCVFTAAAQTAAPTPPAVTECEPEGCIIQLKFQGGQAEAHWGNGAVGNLTIEKYDGQTITMRRTDTAGGSAGLSGVYTGTRTGNDFAGTMTWTWPGHGDLSNGTLKWTATPWATADPVPVSGAVASKLEKSRASVMMGGAGALFYQTCTAQLDFTVLPNGTVADIKQVKVTGSHPLADIARDALSHWTYNPYLVKGAPTAMRVKVLYDFPGRGRVNISYS